MGFCHVVRFQYRRCIRDQIRVRTSSMESTVHDHCGNDDSISKCLQESSVLHWLRLATCALSLSYFSLSVGRTGMHFVLTRLSSSTSISPLSISLVWPDSCSLSAQLLVAGIAHSPFWFQSSPKLRLFLNSVSILPADFKPPNQCIDIVQPRLQHS